jgi:hypothetical protein
MKNIGFKQVTCMFGQILKEKSECERYFNTASKNLMYTVTEMLQNFEFHQLIGFRRQILKKVTK